MTRSVAQVLHETPTNSLFWTYIFGALWGLGGLTFGLTMRYLGMSLGMAVALGYTAVFGTLRSEEHTSELQSRLHLVCRLLLEKKKYIERSRAAACPRPQPIPLIQRRAPSTFCCACLVCLPSPSSPAPPCYYQPLVSPQNSLVS